MKLKVELGETMPDLPRMKKLRHGLRYSIKNRIKEQLQQASTHAELLAQAQRMGGHRDCETENPRRI